MNPTRYSYPLPTQTPTSGARETLRAQNVNDHLLDCSDAHNWAESGDKDSLGRCELWVKADPTFRGLQHALLEFEDRVYVGSEPPKETNVKTRPQRYIRSIEIRKVDGAPLREAWFDCSILFNPGLVAIIGNKGSGKSALADIIAAWGQQPAARQLLVPERAQVSQLARRQVGPF